MIDFTKIPRPTSLKDLPPVPAVDTLATGHAEAIPGTVWEVESPLDEYLLFLLVERFDRSGDADEVPMDWVRAVPLTEHLRVQDEGDVVVYSPEIRDVLLAHVWMEGPVLMRRLRRCVGRISNDSFTEVIATRGSNFPQPRSEVVRAFRDTLHDQFGPVFFEWWDNLERVMAEGTEQEEKTMATAADDNGLSGPKPSEQ
jgi:hypothetical protein